MMLWSSTNRASFLTLGLLLGSQPLTWAQTASSNSTNVSPATNSTSPSAMSPAARERAILRAFYNATGGDTAWTDNSGWADDIDDLCAWVGVICNPTGGGSNSASPTDDGNTRTDDGTDDGNRVVRRQLPQQLYQKKTHHQRELQQDTIAPSNTMAPTTINDDDDDDDDATSAYAQSGRFVIGLVLTDNGLTGTAPDSLWELPHLAYLDLSFNPHLDVTLSNIRAASTIQTIKLRDTGTTSVAGISAANGTMISLHISGSPLEAPIPDELLALTLLQYLHMSSCALSGKIPDAMGNLSWLKQLNLAGNSLTGDIPSSLANLQDLQVLALGKNHLAGSLPNELVSNWTALTNFYADANMLGGSLPSFATQPNLATLYLQNNAFTGTIPADFLAQVATNPQAVGSGTNSDSSNQIKIDLSGNHLNGTVPASLDNLAHLFSSISLADNEFTNVSQALCDNVRWNRGSVRFFGCHGLLCPAQTYAPAGYALGESDCLPCDSVQVWGATLCLNSGDLSILQALFVATGGNGWFNHDGWMMGHNYCDWYGIECWESTNSTNGHVRTINLAKNNLTGSVPETIFHLPYLEELNLSRNPVKLIFTLIGDNKYIRTINMASTLTKVFTGLEEANTVLQKFYADRLPINDVIPRAIYYLRSLRVLSMSECGLKGTLDADIGRIGIISELYLHGNSLRGTIPSDIGELRNLTILSLAKNQLTGPLPTELASLTALEAFSVEDQVSKGGGLTGPILDFQNSEFMYSLMLGGNKFDGSVPTSLLANADTTSPIIVDLSNNQFSGTVPGALAAFDQLNLYMEGNRITDIDPTLCTMSDWMSGGVGLYSCNAILCPSNSSGGRQIYNNEPCSPCTVSPGSPLVLGREQCTVDTPLSEKAILEMLYNQCGGSGWRNHWNWKSNLFGICNWHGIRCNRKKSVKSINLSNNKLVGSIPTEIFLLPSLEKLTLDNNEIAFSFDGIDNAKNLNILSLSSAGITSLNGLGKARRLEELYVQSNKLSGRMPQDLSRLVNLKSVDVSGNSLTGEIPFWLSTLPHLEKIKAANNNFTGLLYDFADLRNLTYLDLSGNRLTGPVPSTLLERTNKNANIVVNLSNNQLTGTLPSALNKFPNLNLDAHDNKITAIADCSIGSWNGNLVSKFGCNAILCPVGFANSDGRQKTIASPCIVCPAATYMGSTACHGSSRR